MRRRVKLLVPFLLSIGPLWILFFSNVESTILKVAGAVGALGLSLGLVLLLSMVYSMQRRIESLEANLRDTTTSSQYDFE